MSIQHFWKHNLHVIMQNPVYFGSAVFAGRTLVPQHFSEILYHYDLRFSHASWLILNWTSEAFCNVSWPAVNTTVYQVGSFAGPAGLFGVKINLF
jgi:hypothetical protein